MPEVLDNYDFMDQRYLRKPEKVYTSAPTVNEGEDGEVRVVQDRNEYVMYIKSSGQWYIFREDTLRPSAGSMFVDDADLEIVITTAGTYYDVTPFEGSEVTGGMKWSTGNLIIPVTGWYHLTHHGSFHGSASTTYHISLFNGPDKIHNLSVERKIGTGNDVGAYGASGIVELKVDNKVNMKVTADSSSKSFHMNHGSVTAILL